MGLRGLQQTENNTLDYAIKFQGELVLGCVSGDGHAAHEIWALTSATITTNVFIHCIPFPGV
jgi:hypothetical protein